MAYNQFDQRTYEVSAPGFAERNAHRLRRVGHALASLPVVGWFVAPIVAPIATGAAALLETGSSLAAGQYSKGFKQAVAGTVDTAVTTVTGAFWWLNAASGIFTGSTIAEHSRQLTNWGLDSIDDISGRPSRAAQQLQANIAATNAARMNYAVSAQPQINASVPATVAYAPEFAQQMQTQAAPTTQFTDRVAAARGQSPQEARANFMRDGESREHVAALNAARENQPQQQSVTV